MKSRNVITEILSVTTALALLCLPLTNYMNAKPEAGATVLMTVSGAKGSGVNIGDGLYVTANHVIENGLKVGNPLVFLKNDRGEQTVGFIFASSPEYDIGFVSVIDSNFAKQMFVNCDSLAIGTDVKMIGNPDKFEFLEFEGNVAGKKIQNNPWKEVYPINGDIIPGMSGGSMIDPTGRLAGVNIGYQPLSTDGKTPSFSGISYAVPSDIVCDFIAGKRELNLYTFAKERKENGS